MLRVDEVQQRPYRYEQYLPGNLGIDWTGRNKIDDSGYSKKLVLGINMKKNQFLGMKS